VSTTRLYQARYGLFAHYASDACIGASLDHYGEWAEGEIHELSRYVSPGSVVLDIGANVGTHTVALARLVGEAGFVIAVEAQPEIYQLLSTNIVLNQVQDRAIALNNLAGSRPDIIEYTASPDKAVENFGAVSFAQDRATVVAERKVMTRLPMIRIDDMGLTRCDLIKIDVEGMEIDVLRGARDVLSAFRPVVYFEQRSAAHFAEIFDLLAEFGYRMYWHVCNPFNTNNFKGSNLNIFGGATELNVLCLPHEKGALLHMPQIMTGEFAPPTIALDEGLMGEAVPPTNLPSPPAIVSLGGGGAADQLLVDLKAVLADRAVAQQIMESQQTIIDAVRRAVLPAT